MVSDQTTVQKMPAQAERMIQNVGCHYVIDIDIKSFFDNVNHGKLLKQMWTLGIRDKKLLSIISAMLKAEVAGIVFPKRVRHRAVSFPHCCQTSS